MKHSDAELSVCNWCILYSQSTQNHAIITDCSPPPSNTCIFHLHGKELQCVKIHADTVGTYVTVIHLSCPKTKAFWYRLLKEMLLPDMPIAFNPIDEVARDEDVGGGPYFGYCNVPRLTSNLPLPDLWVVNPLTCGKGCTPFSETDHRKDQAIFLGRPTGKQTREQCGHGHA